MVFKHRTKAKVSEAEHRRVRRHGLWASKSIGVDAERKRAKLVIIFVGIRLLYFGFPARESGRLIGLILFLPRMH